MIVCADCGALNRPDFRFCRDCGAELTTTTAAGEAPAAFGQAPWAESAAVRAEGQAQQPELAPPAGLQRSAGEATTCTRCGANNPRGMRFCTICGASLVQVAPRVSPVDVPLLCSSCGGMTRPGYRFCHHCGTKIVGLVNPAVAEGAPVPAAMPSAVTDATFATHKAAPAAQDELHGTMIDPAGQLVAAVATAAAGVRHVDGAVGQQVQDQSDREGAATASVAALGVVAGAQVVVDERGHAQVLPVSAARELVAPTILSLGPAGSPELDDPRQAKAAPYAVVAKPTPAGGLRKVDPPAGIEAVAAAVVEAAVLTSSPASEPAISTNAQLLGGQQALPEKEAPARVLVSRSSEPVVKISAVSSGAAAEVSGRAQLVSVQPDGSDGAVFPLEGPTFDVGRTQGQLCFPDDPYLTERHARFSWFEQQWWVDDLGSVNGVYIRFRGQRPLLDGDRLLLGKQVLAFDLLAQAEAQSLPAMQDGVVLFGSPIEQPWGRLRQLTVAGMYRNTYYLTRLRLTVGREGEDVSFPLDEFMSRKHLALSLVDGAPYVEDLDSSNGTFIKIRQHQPLVSGQMLRMGDRLMRFEQGAS